MRPISCFIIAKNEELQIAKAINSVKNIASEIIVIDSGSTDKTIEIAKKHGATVIHNDWQGYLEQKKFGESKCQNDWIINLDADEEISTNLEQEIINIFSAGYEDRYAAYNIKMLILHRKDKKPRLFAPCNYYMRLYNKKLVSFANNEGDSTHDDVKLAKDITKENIYLLDGAIWHRSGTSITQLVNKANFYSSQQAESLSLKNRKFSNFRLVGEFFIWFFKAYFIRRYFIFGIDGFVDAMTFSFARFLRLAKLREIYLRNKKN